MKRIYYNMIMLIAIALTGLSLTACSEDDLDTNQYGSGVSLNVYGPQPVMRGGMLRFLGSNLDQIAQVKIPGVDPITNIEVIKSGVPSEIRVTVPKDGPEEGYVTLVTKTDKEITTITKLTYEEPIEITSITASAMPGETITIEGDYLNLIQMVQFANDDENVYVGQNDFVEHTRYTIKLVVPEEARTGKLNLYTLDLTDENNDPNSVSYNIMETDDAITIGTPTVSKLASPRGEAEATGGITAKQGETITITGNYYNLVSSVAIGDVDGEGEIVTISDITVSEDGKTLSFVLPAEAPDGDINLVARSGVEIPVGILTTVAPSECVAAPSPVKAGAALTITGKDLDVVSSVVFLKSDNTTEIGDNAFTCNEDGTKLIITAVPDEAVEGNLILRMANGKDTQVAFTLVKPKVSGYNSASVSAGGALEIKGTDLDLVKSVTFGEAVVESSAFASQTATSISLTVPMEATSGAPILTLANGTTVEAPSLTIDEAVFCYATALPGEEDEIKAGTTLTLTVKNMDKLTGVTIDGTTCQYITSGDETLIIGVPNTAGSGSKVTLISSNGQISYTIDFIPASQVSKTVWSGLTQLSWSDGGRVVIPASSFENVPDGAIMTLCYSQVDQQWDQAQINFGDWSGCDWTIQAHDGESLSKTSFTQTLVPTDVYGWFSDGILNRETQLVLTQDILDKIQAKKGDCEDVTNAGIIIQGSGLTFSKVTLSYTNSLETTIWSGNQDLGSWSINYEINDGNGNANLFAGACKAGTVLRVYVDAYNAWSQIQLFDGHWAGLAFTNNGSSNNFNSDMAQWAEHPTYYEVTLTASEAERLNTLYDWGYCLIIQGEGCILKKVTIQ